MSRIKIKTTEIPNTWFSARCRNLISKYALLAHETDKVVFDLRGDRILGDIGDHANITDNMDLKVIYEDIKEELRRLLAQPEFRSKLNVMAESVYDDDKQSHH